MAFLSLSMSSPVCECGDVDPVACPDLEEFESDADGKGDGVRAATLGDCPAFESIRSLCPNPSFWLLLMLLSFPAAPVGSWWLLLLLTWTSFSRVEGEVGDVSIRSTSKGDVGDSGLFPSLLLLFPAYDCLLYSRGPGRGLFVGSLSQ